MVCRLETNLSWLLRISYGVSWINLTILFFFSSFIHSKLHSPVRIIGDYYIIQLRYMNW